MTSRRPSMPVSRDDGVDVLPGEQEAHEVGGADRLDLRAQAIERVAMDAREQTTVAPFDGADRDRIRVRDRVERSRAARRLPIRAPAAPCRPRASLDRQRRGQCRAAVVGPTIDSRPRSELDDGVFARPRSRGACGRRGDGRIQ